MLQRAAAMMPQNCLLLSVKRFVTTLQAHRQARMQAASPEHPTFAFKAPECVLGNGNVMPGDIFSLGSLLFFALAGRLPFPVAEGEIAEAWAARASRLELDIPQHGTYPRVFWPAMQLCRSDRGIVLEQCSTVETTHHHPSCCKEQNQHCLHVFLWYSASMSVVRMFGITCFVEVANDVDVLICRCSFKHRGPSQLATRDARAS